MNNINPISKLKYRVRVIKVKTKLFILFSALILSFVLFVSVSLTKFLNKLLLDDVISQSNIISEMLAGNIAAAVDFNDVIDLNESIENAFVNTNIEYLVVKSMNDEIIYSHRLNSAEKHQFNSIDSNQVSKNGLIYQNYNVIKINNRKIGKLYIGYSLRAYKIDIYEIRTTIIYFGVGLLFIGLIISYLISTIFINPISNISKVINELSIDDLSKRVAIESNDEIGDLAKSFNIMMEKLENTNNEMKLLNASLESKNDELHNHLITKDKFFSIIAHDLKSPIGALKNMLNLLCDSSVDFSEDEKKNILELVRDSSNNIYSLLDNLLEWSRTQRGQIIFNPEFVLLNSLVLNNLNLLGSNAVNKQIQIDVNIPKTMNIYADTSMLNTILRNLISNAIKFTPMGGKIEIGAYVTAIDPFITIFIKDNGIGMSPKLLKSLFKIEESSSVAGTNGEKGTGLGLILCKEFIEKHKGSIWVESKVDVGTTFFFTLPKSS